MGISIFLTIISATLQLSGAYNVKQIDEDEWLNSIDFSHLLELGFRNYTGYGTEWILFPDGKGFPHFVNLTTPVLQLRSGLIKNIQYRFYTRTNGSDYLILDQSARSVNGTHIGELLANKKIKVVTHGWMSSADDSVVMGIKESYLKHQEVAVIGVDWSDTAKDFLYPTVASETSSIGSLVGEFLDAFCKLYNVSGDKLHLIGHSLGAHVMGIAASMSNITVSRITGLDPARPLFEFPMKPTSLSLDFSDADFVDVIHSCSGVLGVKNPIGHVDFYPNSGTPPQPGCGTIFFLLDACSHGRSHIYFAESIGNPTGFPACQNVNWTDYLSNKDCNNLTYMGEYVDRNATGEYYLKTNAKEPYARNSRSQFHNKSIDTVKYYKSHSHTLK